MLGLPASHALRIPPGALQDVAVGPRASVNFVFDNGQEARYVRRSSDYFIVYLSSHSGCNLACRFCFLTQTGQTSFKEASLDDMLAQGEAVLPHHVAENASGSQPAAQVVHFNWMARGEPLASSVILTQWAELSARLDGAAKAEGLQTARFNISSIFPSILANQPLVFDGLHRPVLFYSLYSMSAKFRKRWLPKAMPVESALSRLRGWQIATGGEVVLHWALIEGENDRPEDVAEITEAVTRHGLVARFNLVRYNPFSAAQGSEPPEAVLQARFSEMGFAMMARGSRIVPRVGFDVKASCGMYFQA